MTALGWKKTALISGGCALVLALGSGAYALAVSGDDAEHPRASTGAAKAPARITGAGNTVCKVGYDTQSGTNTPPDDTTADNSAAGIVVMKKPCTGAVLATFSSEVSTPNAADFIHIDIRATCLGTAGLTNACTPGQAVFASPGHSFLQNGPASFHVSSITMAWTNLPRGRWAFEVLPGGNNSANLQFRSFTVQAVQGG